VEMAQINVVQMLENSLTIIRETAARKNVSLELAMEKEIEEMIIFADELKLRQVILNLLSNAVKFTPEGGRIMLQVTKATHEMLFSVRDSGIGIEPWDKDRIFRAFEQVDATTTRQHQGTGLGLALARKLVALHGGRIWVESEGKGKGSTFAFAIPIKEHAFSGKGLP
jgi:signal transduction histidine kinase